MYVKLFKNLEKEILTWYRENKNNISQGNNHFFRRAWHWLVQHGHQTLQQLTEKINFQSWVWHGKIMRCQWEVLLFYTIHIEVAYESMMKASKMYISTELFLFCHISTELDSQHPNYWYDLRKTFTWYIFYWSSCTQVIIL